MSDANVVRGSQGSVRPRKPKKHPAGRALGRTILVVVLTLGAIAMIAPFIWMLLTSLKTPAELTTFTWLPKTLRWRNYIDALSSAPFGLYFRNTVILTVGQTAITLAFATSAGYALACTPMRGRKVLSGFVIVMIMVPFYVILVPEFLIVKSIPFFGGNNILGQGGTGWLNSWWGLIIPFAIEASTMRLVATMATIIRTTAPQRSTQGARLKKAHHTTIANAPKSPPRIPKAPTAGTTMGTTNLTRHSSTAAATPGHNRSGFSGAGARVCAMVISDRYSPNGRFVPFFWTGWRTHPPRGAAS